MSNAPADLTRLQHALQGRYRIERELGAGGMATVYLAEDLKHDRKVAIKVLKPELAAVLGAERFVVEIKTTASMSHPHILPLFDSGTADGFLFYVMPYIQGETIREKLNRETQFGVDEAVRIAREIADALDYAHRHGVIHRDIKPENILLHDGRAMVMDFGIALAVSAAAGGRMTETGLSLGTPHYMSPEQATAEKEITARSDQYSLASVLYEMLAGQPPHIGGAAQQVIMKIITETADPVTKYRRSVAPNVSAAVARALEKLPADRFGSAKAFSDALGNATFATQGVRAADSASTVGPKSRALTLAPWLIAAAAIGWAVLRPPPAPDSAPVVRFNLSVPREVRFGISNSTVAVSPSGDAIMVGSMVQERLGLFIRTLDHPAFVPVGGTAGARSGFFSPDGSQVGFVAAGQLRTVPRSGGAPRTLVTTQGISNGIAWSDRDEIAYTIEGTGRGDGGLFLVPAAGGEPRLLLAPDTTRRENEYFDPCFLPGGKVILFTIASNAYSTFKLAAVTTEGKLTRFDVDAVTPRYTNDGHVIVDNLAGQLSAIPFDAGAVRVTGPSVPVLEGVAQRSNTAAVWDLSPSGTLVTVAASLESSLMGVTRAGAALPLTPELRRYRRPQISPDGKRIVVEVAPRGGSVAGSATQTTDLWMIDLGAQTSNRFSFGATSMDPAWTRNGKRVAFARRESTNGEFDLFWQPADGSGAAEPLYQGPGSQWPYGFSADGKTVLIDEVVSGGNVRLATIEIGNKDAKPQPLFDSPFSNRLVRMSKDGKWIAYAGNENNRNEIFVRPFPGPGGKWQVSTEGGDQPLWNPNGKEIFYRSGQKVMVASVETSPTFSVTGRRELFDDVYDQAGTQNWDVFPDGNRFVMVKPSTGDQQILSVVVNWTKELKKVAAPR